MSFTQIAKQMSANILPLFRAEVQQPIITSQILDLTDAAAGTGNDPANHAV